MVILVLNQPSFIGRNVLVGIPQQLKIGVLEQNFAGASMQHCQLQNLLNWKTCFLESKNGQIYIVFIVKYTQ
jgi:hypothetical protein